MLKIGDRVIIDPPHWDEPVRGVITDICDCGYNRAGRCENFGPCPGHVGTNNLAASCWGFSKRDGSDGNEYYCRKVETKAEALCLKLVTK